MSQYELLLDEEPNINIPGIKQDIWHYIEKALDLKTKSIDYSKYFVVRAYRLYLENRDEISGLEIPAAIYNTSWNIKKYENSLKEFKNKDIENMATEIFGEVAGNKETPEQE